MNIVRHPRKLMGSILLIIASFAATSGHPHNNGSQINVALDEIRTLVANISKETERQTIVEERLKSEMKRMRDGMNSAIGELKPEIQSVRMELVNVGQKLEETLLMGIEEAGNRTIDALRPDRELHESQPVPPGSSPPIYYHGSMILPEYPKNCEEIQLLGHNSSGVYRVYPFDLKEFPIGREVYCDLLTLGGGWTVIQRRKESLNTQEDFERTWDEYASGFGNLNESHWIGLNIIAALTKAGDNRLRIEMTDWEGENRVAAYSNFWIASASDLYRINAYGYYGDAGDSLAYHNGMAFTTKDRDYDESSMDNCAQIYNGAWWFRKCHYSNLNGIYFGENNATVVSNRGHGIVWLGWRGGRYSLKRTELKVRSNHFQP